MKRYKIIYAMFCIVSLCSCELLRQSRFEVVHCSPDAGYHAETEELVVSVEFSHEPNREKIQKAFSVTEDAIALQGKYIWSGKTLEFRPSLPLKKNKEYKVTVSIDAEDAKGVSLDEQFERSWTSSPSKVRPEILSVSPANNGEVSNASASVLIYFNVEVPMQSLMDYVSFTPSISGYWKLDETQKTAEFTPYEKWKPCTEYKISVRQGFESEHGNTIAKEFGSRFTVGGDDVKPQLLRAVVLQKDSSIALKNKADYVLECADVDDIDGSVINDGWEADYKLLFKFSKDVNASTVLNAVTAEPAISFELENGPGYYSDIVIKFTKRPAYNAHYILRLGNTVSDSSGNTKENVEQYKIFTDGAKSKPPELKGFALPVNPAGGASASAIIITDRDNFTLPGLNLDADYYTVDAEIPTWMMLFFDAAHGAEINLFSLMESLSFSATNSSVTWTPEIIVNHSDEFTWRCNSPIYQDEEYRNELSGCIAIEIKGILVNDPTRRGLVTFSCDAGLRDSYGNESTITKQFVLIK
jgi:hypothetical protein